MTGSILGIDIKATLRELKDGLKWAASFAGAPVELAHLVRLETAVAKTLQSWLRKLERLADNLLTALAAEIAPAEPPAKPPAGLFARLAKTADGPDLKDEDSGRWRGIRYAGVLGAPPIVGAPARGRRRPQAPIDPSTHEAADGVPTEGVPTAALARRLEALIRIAEHPRRFARRLLRRNARRAERAKRRPPARRLVADRPAWLKPKLPPPRIRWIDTG